ncbi:MAG: ribonuclease HII [Actinomycetota bacterium]
MASKQVQRPVAKRRKRAARRKKPKPPPQPVVRRPAGRLEEILRRQGFRFVAGVDEVGRGSLAGPLVTAAVCLDVHELPENLCDSKMLTAEEREACASDIMRLAVGVSYVVVDSEDIDDDGLGVSNLAALRRAVRALHPTPQYVISDHFPMDEDGAPWVGLPKADALSAAVAAASIVAKVSRDAFMAALDASHPGYNFASNKGYGTDEHWSAIRALGPSPVHRRSFRGVASYQPTLADI